MELHERIRKLRKTLKMSQTQFGEKLGVSRSVINNIERNVLARPDQKLSLMKLICSEFNVNENWLLNGTEPMFTEPDSFSLNEFVKSRGATAFELEIIKAYFELDPEIRRTTIEHFKKKLSSYVDATSPADDVPDTPDELEMNYPPIAPENKETRIG